MHLDFHDIFHFPPNRFPNFGSFYACLCSGLLQYLFSTKIWVCFRLFVFLKKKDVMMSECLFLWRPGGQGWQHNRLQVWYQYSEIHGKSLCCWNQSIIAKNHTIFHCIIQRELNRELINEISYSSISFMLRWLSIISRPYRKTAELFISVDKI